MISFVTSPKHKLAQALILLSICLFSYLLVIQQQDVSEQF